MTISANGAQLMKRRTFLKLVVPEEPGFGLRLSL